MPKAKDLHSLINNSVSSRQYFMSLPVQMQINLHTYNSSIRTQQDLRRYASVLATHPCSNNPLNFR